MFGKAVQNKVKEFCDNGHEYTSENTYTTSAGWRQCRTCRRLTSRGRKRIGRSREAHLEVIRHHEQRSLEPLWNRTAWPIQPDILETRKRRAKVYSRRDKRRRVGLARAFVSEIKRGKQCVDCSGTFAACAMDFDHLPGFDKVASISQLVAQGKSEARIAKEIAKCELVCANCHRVRTSARLKAIGCE